MYKFTLTLVISFLFTFCTYAESIPKNWSSLEELANNSEPLTILTPHNKTKYLKDEKLIIGIANTKSGYLNVIAINQQNETTVLFPNKYYKDNKVNAGGFALPTIKMGFDFKVQPPYGKSLIVAFLTEHKINIYEASSGDLDEPAYKQLSSTEINKFEKSFVVVNKEKIKAKAGKLILITCETTENC